jgi:N6-adenosine-specific RNA methylase IME4
LPAVLALLNETTSVTTAKQIRDRAQALAHYAKTANAGFEAQQECAELKLRAERKAGELLATTPLHNGDPRSQDATRLDDLGINKSQSSRWQRLASLSDFEFEGYIGNAWAARRELTTAGALQLARRVAASDPEVRPRLRVIDGEGLPGLEGQTFTTLVADPPWQYDNKATRNAAGKHYPTMTVAELRDLPVVTHVNDDAHIYLWTTNGFLREAFDVLEAWGFTYKTHLAWIKPQMGLGNYFRCSHEHVLFGVRGSLPTKRRDVMSWFSADRGRHSAKPDSFYDLVEVSSPGPYLEMFARRRRLGDWTVWGNEA